MIFFPLHRIMLNGLKKATELEADAVINIKYDYNG
jgi:uncharacterized protein YbjQ (UPF0145 family)